METFIADREIAQYANRPEPLAYSIADACRVIGIGRTNLYRLIGEGRVRTVKVDKRTLIPAESLRALLAGTAA